MTDPAVVCPTCGRPAPRIITWQQANHPHPLQACPRCAYPTHHYLGAITDEGLTVDEVTTPTCGSCGAQLREDGPSLDFCGEDCAEEWRARHGDDLPAPADPPDSGRIDYPLPNGRVLTVRFTREWTTDQWSRICQVTERFPTVGKFVWYMDRTQWADLATDPVALATIWDHAICTNVARPPNGSWEVTDQRPQERARRVPGGTESSEVDNRTSQ